jgi:sugar lactone lactonase YvrE
MRTANKHLRLFILGLFAAGFGSLQAPAALASSGDLLAGGMSDNVVYRFTSAGARTVFASGIMADSLAFDAFGNLFVSDPQNKRIVKITPGGTATQFAVGQNGEDFVPGGLAFDAAGNLFAVNTANNTIYKYTHAGVRSTFASGLNRPFGVAFDAAGNLFVSEQNSGNILKFAPGGGAPTIFTTGFIVPLGLASDSVGNLFVAEFGTNKAVKVAPNGTHTTINPSALLSPRQIAIDASGNVFVSTVGNGQIVKISTAGTQTVFASGIHPGGLAFEPHTAQLANISTRASVQTGDRVTIAGFIITGTDSKAVVLRGLGPTLSQPPFNISGTLADPTLQLFDGSGPLWFNDNWKDNQQTQIQAASCNGTPCAPKNDSESAILKILPPGNYTAILAGKNGTTGIGLVEVYDISPGVFAELTNVSTRGFVGTGDNVLIGGFITSGGNGSTEVVVRGLGPRLSQPPFNLSGTLADPVVTLVDQNGTAVKTNDNWKNTQQAEIQATGLAPENDVESAMVVPLAAGRYTAILSGHGGTGIGLVEVYKLR